MYSKTIYIGLKLVPIRYFGANGIYDLGTWKSRVIHEGLGIAGLRV